MKKLLLLLAVLGFSASPAFAAGGSLYLAWDDCVANGGPTFKNFDCAGGLGGELYASFKLNTEGAGIVTCNAIMDVNVNGATTLPGFWHFESGGCNEGFLVLTDKRPTGKCAGSATLMCGATGAGCNEFITAYGADYPVGGRARILITLARSAASPVTLTADPAIHFAYQISVDATNAVVPAVCAGCASTVSIALNSIVLESAEANAGGEAVADIITSDMGGSVPGGCINAATCISVPVRSRTWGQLKALYR